MERRFWLVKQEPEAYSWDQFVQERRTSWTGIRNFQARNNLRAMRKGDLVLFYHSVSEKRVVGVAKVAREAYPDPADDNWSTVDLSPFAALRKPVALDTIKNDPLLREMPLIRQSRLSVMPVSEEQFRRLLELAETKLAA